MPEMPEVVLAINYLNSFIVYAIPLRKPHVGCDHTAVEMMRRSRRGDMSIKVKDGVGTGEIRGHEEDVSSSLNK